MNKLPKDRDTRNLEPDSPDTDDSGEPILDGADDDFLDSFLSDDYDDELWTDGFDLTTLSDADGEAEFDRYYRNAVSHSRSRRRWRRRRSRSWDDISEFGSYDERDDDSRGRRPRR